MLISLRSLWDMSMLHVMFTLTVLILKYPFFFSEFSHENLCQCPRGPVLQWLINVLSSLVAYAWGLLTPKTRCGPDVVYPSLLW